MGNLAISVSDLGKKYYLGRSNTLSIGDLVRSLWQERNKKKQEFWALQDVSFDVQIGDALAVIGRNGAGKSTLLKILSRITHPTAGRFEMNGRVASLLEVGTGFHPELSGRENVFLNGTILGMSRTEVREKFDEIVEFSGVSKFIDTPVKHYSSGMYVRLAFAVAAHLEPEILIIDEVLAVGDSEFQKKCIGKMGEVTSEGRTVLFVSHNMGAVKKLCNQGIYLSGGGIKYMGGAKACVDKYLSEFAFKGNLGDLDVSNRRGNGKIVFDTLKLLDAQRKEVGYFSSGDDGCIQLVMSAKEQVDLKLLQVDLGINDQEGNRLLWLSTSVANVENVPVSKPTDFVLETNLKRIPLVAGDYYITLFATYQGDVVDWLGTAYLLRIEEGDFLGSKKTMPYEKSSLLIDHSFSYEKNI